MPQDKEIIENLIKINENIERLIDLVIRVHNYRAPWYQSINKQEEEK
jgi:hypothetical protein